VRCETMLHWRKKSGSELSLLLLLLLLLLGRRGTGRGVAVAARIEDGVDVGRSHDDGWMDG
jgi:hypothetical protein